MKVAITSSGDSFESTIDKRFGRCAYFVIFDTESKASEFIPNPHINASEGAGPASVQLLAEKKVEKIISGEFGLKIKSLLDSLKIQMIIIKEPKSVREITEMLNN